MKKVFIFGYYGFKNIGDEATLASIVTTLKKIDPSIYISALSYSSQYTEKLHEIKAVSRNDVRATLSSIREADLVISGGGSLLQDVTSNRSLIYYLGIIYLAKTMGKKVMFYGNGIGPINKKFNKVLINKIVGMVDMITLRDNDSLRQLVSFGIKKDIEVTADATFVLESAKSDRIGEILVQQEIPIDKPLVGISIRPWKNEEVIKETLSEFCDYLIKRNMNVVFIPMQPSRDVPVSMEVCARMKNKAYVLDKEYKPSEVMGLIGKMDILVGMRLHALIFAANMAVPMLGIEYDPKIKSFLDIIKQVNLGKVEELDTVKLCAEFDKLWDDKAESKNNLNSKGLELKAKAEKNGLLAYSLIK